jgi:hypothetical protein
VPLDLSATAPILAPDADQDATTLPSCLRRLPIHARRDERAARHRRQLAGKDLPNPRDAGVPHTSSRREIRGPAGVFRSGTEVDLKRQANSLSRGEAHALFGYPSSTHACVMGDCGDLPSWEHLPLRRNWARLCRQAQAATSRLSRYESVFCTQQVRVTMVVGAGSVSGLQARGGDRIGQKRTKMKWMPGSGRTRS